MESKDYFVHPRAFNECNSVGKGTRIWAFAHVMEEAVVGEDCNIGECCFIESGASLGNNVTVKNGVSVWAGVHCADDVFLGPSCVFTNDLNPRAAIKKGADHLESTYLEQGVTVGANATIICRITLGKYAFIGAGAIVTKSIPPYSLVLGNPGRCVGYMCECGERLGEGELFCKCGRGYQMQTSPDYPDFPEVMVKVK